MAVATRALGVTVKAVEMNDEMRDAAVDNIKKAVVKEKREKDMARAVRREFDTKYGSGWQCIVGSDFAAHVTHEMDKFIYVYANKYSFVLFKSV